MNDFFAFEQTPWEITEQSLHRGDKLSAVRLLTLLEGESDDAVEAAFASLEELGVTLDISELPADHGTGELESRLRREEKLAASGRFLEELEDTDPLRLYLEELAATPAAGDAQLLAEQYAAGDESVSSRLVSLCLSRVVDIAREMTGRGVLLLDLIQEGSLGLWQGILRYESGDFDSYIDWWIRQSMARTVTMQARSGGVGAKMKKALEDFRAADAVLLTQLGRNPTLPEIAARMQVSLEEAEVYEEMVRSARAMAKNEPAPAEDPAEEDRAVEDTAYFQMRQRILDMLSTLDETEAKVITLRFGLEGGQPCTDRQTAAKLGLTVEEAAKIEAAALEKLRRE